MRIDRRSLWRARPDALRRLARFLGYKPRDCDCTKCRHALIERLVRDERML